MRVNPAFQLLGLGSYVAVCITGGTIGGYFLDKALDTGKALTIAGLAIGLIAALFGGYRMLTETLADIQKWESRQSNGKRK